MALNEGEGTQTDTRRPLSKAETLRLIEALKDTPLDLESLTEEERVFAEEMADLADQGRLDELLQPPIPMTVSELIGLTEWT